MAKVVHYLPEVTARFLCAKGGLHAQEALSIVCLDPLCRHDPLACPICFTHTHKYHRVVSLDKFLDDYASNVRTLSAPKTLRKVEKHHAQVRHLIARLREDVNQELDSFEESINEYAAELRARTAVRDSIGRAMGVELQPGRVRQSGSREELAAFLKVVLSNCCFDKGNNMVRVAEVLRQDEERVHALLDRMVNMTGMCQDYIRDVMKSLSFSEETLKAEKTAFTHRVEQLKVVKDGCDVQQFTSSEALSKTLAQAQTLPKTHWRKGLVSTAGEDRNKEVDQTLTLTFHHLKKHRMIEVREKGKVGVSNISALKPQYALLTPHLTTLPSQVREWAVRVNSCRNFASQNTLAIGMGTADGLQAANFEGAYPRGVTLVTSQGYVIEEGGSRRTSLIFGEGDTLYCSYDPFYGLFQVWKENGRRLSLRVGRGEEELFACVRLTYASDQVQIL